MRLKFLLFFSYFIILFVWCFSCTCVCIVCTFLVPMESRSPRVSDILKVELQTVVRCHVGDENGTWETQILTLNSFTFYIEFMHTPYIMKAPSYNIFY